MSSSRPQPTGVVLAGGASTRMGRDKARLELGGVSLLERAVGNLAFCCEELLVADGGRDLLTGWPSVEDGPGRGPAAGILGAAAARPERHLLVLACDLPLVPMSLLGLLADGVGSADWIVPRHRGRLEPLCALYAPTALDALARQVADGDLAPHRLAEHPGLRVHFVEEGALEELGDPAAMFANVNRPADLDALRIEE